MSFGFNNSKNPGRHFIFPQFVGCMHTKQKRIIFDATISEVSILNGFTLHTFTIYCDFHRMRTWSTVVTIYGRDFGNNIIIKSKRGGEESCICRMPANRFKWWSILYFESYTYVRAYFSPRIGFRSICGWYRG